VPTTVELAQPIAAAALALTRDERDQLASLAWELAAKQGPVAEVWNRLTLLLDHVSASDETRLLNEATSPTVVPPEIMVAGLAHRAAPLVRHLAALDEPTRHVIADAFDDTDDAGALGDLRRAIARAARP
jgi:hypothetical protein